MERMKSGRNTKGCGAGEAERGRCAPRLPRVALTFFLTAQQTPVSRAGPHGLQRPTSQVSVEIRYEARFKILFFPITKDVVVQKDFDCYEM